MTTEEAINVINTWSEPMRKTLKDTLAHEFLDAVDVLKAKEIKYGWHDLRKNPKDLPNKDGEYYAYQYCYYCITSDPNSEVYEPMHTIIFVKDGKISCFGGEEIIAWREIEQFEVEENDNWKIT